MFDTLQVLTVLFVAVAMALTLAHALELPGKMRLTKEIYFAMHPSIIQDSLLAASLSPLPPHRRTGRRSLKLLDWTIKRLASIADYSRCS
jgi:hypothetical protein